MLLSSANSDWWEHLPTHTDVDVRAASVALPWLTYSRDEAIQGDPAPNLAIYKDEAPFAVDAATIEERTEPGFALPGPLQPRPQAGAPAGDAQAAEAAAPSAGLTARRRALGRLDRPPRPRARRLRRGGERSRRARASSCACSAAAGPWPRARVTARYGLYRVRLRARRAGRYRVTASTRIDGVALRARSRPLRLRR